MAELETSKGRSQLFHAAYRRLRGKLRLPLYSEHSLDDEGNLLFYLDEADVSALPAARRLRELRHLRALGFSIVAHEHQVLRYCLSFPPPIDTRGSRHRESAARFADDS